MPIPDHHEPASLEHVASRTLGHYESHADAFWEGTREHDVTQNYAALLEALDRGAAGDGGAGSSGSVKGALRILDFGCGPGRDLIALRAMGHQPVGLDGCAAFVAMAKKHSGCEVLHQSFFALELEAERFDGVFANASLFHVPRGLLPRVLRSLHETLAPGGVLFCSNPRAYELDEEGFQGERYGAYLTAESWTRVIGEAGFTLERQFLRPSGKPPAQQPWLAMVWRKS